MGLQQMVTTTESSPRKLPQYDARDLIETGDQANIILDNQVYVLRITRAGKLILTK
jgi:hemin uptake protein HemP